MSDDDTELIACTVDGCDYSGPLTGLRSHANAKYDHDWEEIVEESGHPALAEHDPGETTSESEGQDGDDQGETTSQDDMPTDDELEQQREQVGATSETTSESEGGQGDGRGESTSQTSSKNNRGLGIPIPVSTTTLVAGVALVLMLVVVTSYARGSSAEPAESTSDTTQDQSQTTSQDDPAPLVEEGEFEGVVADE
jgi:hypothetical protein